MTLAKTPASPRPTIEDVATLARVSRSTVSRYLNGGDHVSSQAAQRIADAIAVTGYRANAPARSLASSSSSRTAVFLLTDTMASLFEDLNFAGLVESCSTCLSDKGWSLVMMMASSPAEQERALAYITAGHVDGVMLFSLSDEDLEFASNLVAAGVRTVACGAPLGAPDDLKIVMADDFAGAQEATRYLLGPCGCTRVAHVSGPAHSGGGQRRLAGYRQAISEAALNEVVIAGDYSAQSGRHAAQHVRDCGADGVFCANDATALGLIEALLETGVRVPEEVQVIGFDDSPRAAEKTPALTTLSQPFGRIAQAMVDYVVDATDAASAPSVHVCPTRLVDRATTRRIR